MGKDKPDPRPLQIKALELLSRITTVRIKPGSNGPRPKNPDREEPGNGDAQEGFSDSQKLLVFSETQLELLQKPDVKNWRIRVAEKADELGPHTQELKELVKEMRAQRATNGNNGVGQKT